MNARRSRMIPAMAAVLLALPIHGYANQAGSPAAQSTQGDAGVAALAEGEVKALDRKHKLIKLKHGPIKSKTVEMPPMTMSFPVQDAALLADIKVGDTVRFNAENVKGTATITDLRPGK